MSRERTPVPVPVQQKMRAFPGVPPNKLWLPAPFPRRVVIADAALAPDARAISGAYLGAGPDMAYIGGRFLGPAAPEGFDPPGNGPLRTLDNFLDRVLWRMTYESKFGLVTWEAVSFFSSLAFTFRHEGLWAVLYTDEVEGRRLVNYYRSPIVFEPLANIRVGASFGPRKHPDRRHKDASGRQFPGHFLSLRDAVSALVGERVEDLATACRLFDIDPPPAGAATPETLPARAHALRDLYVAVRAEAEEWPGVSIGRLASPTAIVAGAYLSSRVPQPLLRDSKTMNVPARCIGAGIEAASIGARTGTFFRRVPVPGLDVDITACYPVGAALAGIQDFLTNVATAHHVTGKTRLDQLRRLVRDAALAGLLEHPELGRSLAFLVNVVPSGDVLTAHVELFGTEATITAPVVEGSRAFWTTGFDLAVAMIEDLDAGGEGRVPDIAEAWTFDLGSRLRGLRPVEFPGGWVWDPRRDSDYRSRDGRTWDNLYLLLAAMRLHAATDPNLTPAARIRRRGLLKVASVAGAFGMFSATTPIEEGAGKPHKVITSDGIAVATSGTPERPGPFAFPPAAALVEGAGRLLLTLVLHEVRTRGGTFAQADTDGTFIVATPDGGEIEVEP